VNGSVIVQKTRLLHGLLTGPHRTVKDEFRLKMKMTDVKQTIIGRHPQSPFTSVELKMMLS